MRFTEKDVEAIGNHIKSVTGNKLGGHYAGLDYSGKGTRIVDTREERVFAGKYAVRRAAAHYLAMALTLARETKEEMPEEFVKYREPLSQSGMLDGHKDFESGKARALSYLRMHHIR